MRLPARRLLPLPAILLFLTGSGSAFAANGPKAGDAADLPVVLGEPFTVDGVSHVPADSAHLDQVGQAVVDPDGGNGISAAHRTLPLPSYAEVTWLQTGRTILVRIERRGPMNNAQLIALSPGAAAQLGIGAAAVPVRVRRVSPPEAERALLRTGQNAPARLDAPAGLLAALRRKLSAQEAPAVAPVAASVTPVVSSAKTPDLPPAQPVSLPPERPAGAVEVAAARKPAVAKPDPASAVKPKESGRYIVQLAAFSTRARADAAAGKVGGTVVASGKFWRLRMGPYPDRGKADVALAKARAAGYSDARIQQGG